MIIWNHHIPVSVNIEKRWKYDKTCIIQHTPYQFAMVSGIDFTEAGSQIS